MFDKKLTNKEDNTTVLAEINVHVAQQDGATAF